MNKELQYMGHSAAPSDYECADGDLSLSLNAIHDDAGGLRPTTPANVLFRLPELHTGEVCNAVVEHKNTGYDHIICHCTYTDADGKTQSVLKWVNREGGHDPGNFHLPPFSAIIGYDDGSATTTTTEEKNVTEYNLGSATFLSADTIGNTLIVITDKGLRYFLWKPKYTYYRYLGDHLPEYSMSFGLQGDFNVWKYPYGYNLEENHWYKIGEEIKEEEDDAYDQTKISSAVFAALNKFLKDKCTDKGKFGLPFMVRYALRLYDGSLAMHSSPVLMTAANGKFPMVFHLAHGDNDNLVSGDEGLVYRNADQLFVGGFQFDLDYIIPKEIVQNLKNWEDIITSVDIFISAPIYLFNVDGKVKNTQWLSAYYKKVLTHSKIRWVEQAGHAFYTVKALSYIYWNWFADGTKIKKLSDDEEEFSQSEIIEHCDTESFSARDTMSIATRYCYVYDLPDSLNGKDLYKIAKDTSSFYLLKSIKVKDLVPDAETIVEVEDEYLQSLVNREVMTDDYDSHDTIIPQFAQAYNSRINFANIEKTIYNNYDPTSMVERINGFTVKKELTNAAGDVTYTRFIDEAYNGALYFFFHINQNGYEYITQGISGTNVAYRDDSDFYPKQFVFYPNVNAYKVSVYMAAEYNKDKWYARDFDMTPSDFLNGAYAIIPPINGLLQVNGVVHTPIGGTSLLPTASDSLTVDLPNKIYMSDVNNPFHFATTSIYTVGTGTILGISTAAKALSQGQFGQYPLYAFCTDGIWALEISSTGTYSAKQPITRDVCINSDGILQLDNSVLYITDRGIMLIQGSDSTCISDGINAPRNFDLTSLPQFSALVDLFNKDYYDTAHAIKGDDINQFRLMEFLGDCRMLYDYVHQRVVFYNTAYRMAYVYSLKTNLWGHMYVNLRSNILSYPEALATDNDGNLVDFSDDQTVTGQPAFLVTRPLKVDAPNIHKTVDTILQRGYFRHGHVQQLLYASNDLRTWFLVRSSVDEYLRGFSGTPYKYFRIAVLARMDNDETIFGSSLQFTPRLNNQLR